MDGITNRSIAVAAAARLVLSGVDKVLNDPRAPAQALSEAIIPIFGIRWNREVCQRTGGINNMLCRLRNSMLPKADYLKLRELFKEVLFLNGPLPPNWEEWLAIIEKFEMGNTVKHSEWVAVIMDFKTIGFDSPMDLSRLNLSALSELLIQNERLKLARQMWQACVLCYTSPSEGDIYEIHGASDEAEKLIDRIKGGELRKSNISKSLRFHTNKLKQKKNFADLGPAAKLKALKDANLSRSRTSKFFEAGATVNILKASRKTLGGWLQRLGAIFSFASSRAFAHSQLGENMCSNGARCLRMVRLSNSM